MPALLQILLDQGYEESEARGLLLAGKVLVDEKVQSSAALKIKPNQQVRVKTARFYPSRAALKLQSALDHFDFEVCQAICLDLGASHGGFTKVLLEAGAAQVYAIDVAYGIFDYELRKDPRTSLLEKHNVRYMHRDWFAVDAFASIDAARPLVVVCDISFMSLRTVLKSLKLFLDGDQHDPLRKGLPMRGLFLLKPQFEDSASTRGGIQQDAAVVQSIRDDFAVFLNVQGFTLLDSAPARVRGRAGNQEFVYFLEYLPD